MVERLLWEQRVAGSNPAIPKFKVNMKIENIRLGFATNSSSLHSIVILPDKIRPDKDYTDHPGEYGWDNFTLVSQLEKRRYMAILLKPHIEELIGSELTTTLLENLLDVRINPDDYIDHQSTQNFPRDIKGHINMDYLRDYIEFIKRRDVAILGGNDNGGEHPLIEEPGVINLGIPHLLKETENIIRAHKDDISGHWVLFDTTNGHKVSLSFDAPAAARSFSSFPELVDISITDYCDAGCRYCYRASTENGKHAKLSYINEIIDSLVKVGTFEVAIGGGEPTTHPEFGTILKMFKEDGIIPNFTTRRTDWMQDDRKEGYLSSCGSFAFSVDSFYDFMDMLNIALSNRVPLNKINIQIVDKTIHHSELNRILDACDLHGLRVTILGYKTTGFGARFIKPDQNRDPIKTDWLKSLQESKICMIGIDTTIAKEYEKELEARKVPKYLYRIEEGMFSMFIDAVAKKAGPSSYCFNSQYVSMPHPTAGDILSVFNVFHTYKQIDKPARAVLNT